MLFKLLITYPIVFVIVSCEWDNAKKECVKELKLGEILTRLLDENVIVSEKNIDYQNFLECYWRKRHLIDEMGVINWNLVIEDISKRMSKKLGNTIKQQGSNISTAVAVRLAIMECGRPKILGNSEGHIALQIQNCVGEMVERN